MPVNGWVSVMSLLLFALVFALDLVTEIPFACRCLVKWLYFILFSINGSVLTYIILSRNFSLGASIIWKCSRCKIDYASTGVVNF